MKLSSLALVPLAGVLAGVTMAVTTPQQAAAEKLPVDCSGRYTDCYERKQCTRYNEDHRCVERTTEMWHWYATGPLK